MRELLDELNRLEHLSQTNESIGDFMKWQILKSKAHRNLIEALEVCLNTLNIIEVESDSKVDTPRARLAEMSCEALNALAKLDALAREVGK